MDCVLELVKVSIGLLCSKLPLLLLITLVLIFPVSAITLSQVMTNSLWAGQLSTCFHHYIDVQAGLRLSAFSRLFYSQLSQTLVAHALCFPIIITLWMLAKATVFYVMKCMERGHEVSVMGFLEEGPKIWSRVATTYVAGCLLVMLITALMALLDIAVLVAVQKAMADTVGYNGLMYIILEMAILTMYAMLLAPMVVVLNMSSVVAAMEERRYGGHALLRAFSLLKHKKIQPALLLFLVTGIASMLIECGFQYRVLGRGSASMLASMHILEAPFLIFAHSFVCLLDTLMSFSFYYACQSAADMSRCHRRGTGQKDEVEDHFSMAMQIVEHQCRKIMFMV